MAFAQFEYEEDYPTPLKVMLTQVLPILDTMQADDTAVQDIDFAGAIKDRWVNTLVDDSIDGKY